MPGVPDSNRRFETSPPKNSTLVDQSPKAKFYPMMSIMTGPPPLTRNGGIWKFVKIWAFQGHTPKRFLTQVLHYLDFGMKADRLDKWLGKSIDQHFSDIKVDGSEWDIFADSGGYQLMSGRLTTEENSDINSEHVFNIQKWLGANRICQLDYPFYPGISENEMIRRSKINEDHLVDLIGFLKECSDYNPTPYAAVHGRNSDEYYENVLSILQFIENLGETTEKWGLAIGSLVPLKNRPNKIFRILQSIDQALELYDYPIAGVHVFGVSPLVVRAKGIQSITGFDNGSYIQAALNRKLMHPQTLRGQSFSKIKINPECCFGCKKLIDFGINEVSNGLALPPRERPIDRYGRDTIKSEIYANFAIHNLLKTDEVIPDTIPVSNSKQTRIEMTHFSNEHLIENAPILLLPCSSVKPYRFSRIHRATTLKLMEHELYEGRDFIRITLSGLHGLVPSDREDSIPDYDFPLTNSTSEGTLSRLIQLVSDQWKTIIGDRLVFGIFQGSIYRYIISCINHTNLVLLPKDNIGPPAINIRNAISTLPEVMNNATTR